MAIRLLIKKSNSKVWSRLAIRQDGSDASMKEIEEIRDGWLLRGSDEYKTAKYLIQTVQREYEPFPTDEVVTENAS